MGQRVATEDRKIGHPIVYHYLTKDPISLSLVIESILEVVKGCDDEPHFTLEKRVNWDISLQF